MRVAAVLTLLIIAMLAASSGGSVVARSETQAPIEASAA
jgi:hypothetical protein